ncbi:sensor histidine kinase [Arthrobacter sp. M4]|uniref:sensor histidine kinase n=1 Tax=Arthrobacter sp. M4 TaxID=218160 RepID=UPI001CDC824C|nr:sensor histidine kinase [Arthrobacter sp. M4]MCA4132560.1 sensor histidine kinase [Arthrobacter sp. M4]
MPVTEPLRPRVGIETTGPGNPPTGLEAAPSAAILRVLRVTLHVGFAALLGVAVLRLLTSGIGAPLRYVWVGTALVLAVAYLTGTVLEKRFATGRTAFDPRRYGVLWIGLVTALWVILLAGSAEFAWVAFPLFFLHLHLLTRRIALLTITLMTVAVVAAQWAASGMAAPHLAIVLGPLFGAVFSVVTGLGYLALYREAENQRRAAEELRRTRAELAASQHDAGVLAERGRLAREIHDTLAQGLSSIVLVARAAEKSLADGDTETAAARLALVQHTASENLAEARNFVRGLASPKLQDSSLMEALRRLCEETENSAAARESELRCRLEVDGDPVELQQQHTVTLLRAAQASLANVRDHAKASNAVVTVAFLGSEVTMDIYDDGVGFDPSGMNDSIHARTDGRGFGTLSLAERITALNGSLELESAPGEGTTVALRLPVDDIYKGEAP